MPAHEVLHYFRLLWDASSTVTTPGLWTGIIMLLEAG